MAEIDPELRDKIIETHTMMKVVVKDQDEHKTIMNARLRDMKKEFADHKNDTKFIFEKHDARLETGEHFRTKVMTYVTMIAVGGALVIELAVVGGKKILGVI